MALKLTKNEQKLQKDRLKQYQRYLPTLQLKKQQLQQVIMAGQTELAALKAQRLRVIGDLDDWIAVFAENALFDETVKLENLVVPVRVVLITENVAGVNTPVLEEVIFKEAAYDADALPLWVDTAAVRLREIARFDALIATLQKKLALLENELRATAQRVNLFEKVKIPEAMENIRIISIYLGDQQTAEVVRGKIAKKKRPEAAQ